MADELEPEAAFESLRKLLHRRPEGMRRGEGPIESGDEAVVASIGQWLDEVFRLIPVCGVWIKHPVAGRGLDSFWLRKFTEFAASIEKGRRRTSSLAYFLCENDHLGLDLNPYEEAAYYIAKFRANATAGGIASLLEDDEPGLLSQLRSLAEEYEQRCIDSLLPPRHGPGPMHLVTRDTPAQNELEGANNDFEADCGSLLLRAVDDLLVPDELRKHPEFVDQVFAHFRHGMTGGRGVFNWLCQRWLPTVKAGHGGPQFDYPDADRDDAERLNTGIRRARCAVALADELDPPKRPTSGTLADPTFQEPINTSAVGSMAVSTLIDEWFHLYGSLFFWGAWQGEATEALTMRRQAGLMRFKTVTKEVADRGEGLGVDASTLYRMAGMLHSVGNYGEVLTVPDALKDEVHAVVERIRARTKAKQQGVVTTSADALAAQFGGSVGQSSSAGGHGVRATASPDSHQTSRPDSALIDTAFERVRGRFEEGFRRHARLIGVMVHHSSPIQREQPEWPDAFVEGLPFLGVSDGLSSEVVQLGGREDYARVADRPFLDAHGAPIVNSAGEPIPMRPSWERSIALYGPEGAADGPLSESAGVLRTCCAEAGLLLRNLNQEVRNVVWQDWTGRVLLPDDAGLWLSAVFELAWQDHDGAGLKAGRSGWLERQSAPIELITKRFNNPSSPSLIEELADAVGDPPGYWFSRIENLWQASVAAIDLLASMANQGETATTLESPTTSTSDATGSSDPQPRSIEDLEKATAQLDRENGEWVKNKRAAELEGLETRTLSDYRKSGEKTTDGRFGKDKDGRIWRRDGTERSHPLYLRSSLRSQSKP